MDTCIYNPTIYWVCMSVYVCIYIYTHRSGVPYHLVQTGWRAGLFSQIRIAKFARKLCFGFRRPSPSFQKHLYGEPWPFAITPWAGNLNLKRCGNPWKAYAGLERRCALLGNLFLIPCWCREVLLSTERIRKRLNCQR